MINNKDTIKSKNLLLYPRLILSTPFFVIAILIFLFSHIPHPEFPNIGIEWEDKIMHFFVYFIFGITVIVFILSNSKKNNLRFVAIISILIGSFYGLSDEIHQYFIPGRDAEFLDWIADLFGILISLIFIKSLKRKVDKVYAR